MQLIAEYIRLLIALLGIFFENRSTGEPEEDGVRESILDIPQHIAEGRTVRFIHDEYNPFFANQRNIAGVATAFFILDVAHLLNGGHNQRIRRRAAFELAQQHIGVLRGLYALVFIGKRTIFL